MKKTMRKTILATALLAATSMAFAKDGNKPDSPPSGNAPAGQRSEFGQDTAERARTVGADVDARATMGEDTSAAAQVRGDLVVDDDEDSDDGDDGNELPPEPLPEEPVEDDDDDEVPPPTDPVEPDADGDGIPDDDDGDDDGDGETDEWADQPANTFGQETSDAARADDREGGLNNRDAAHERNELRSMDTDGDGSNDYLDTDDDGDGISDDEELDADDDDDGTVDDTDPDDGTGA